MSLQLFGADEVIEQVNISPSCNTYFVKFDINDKGDPIYPYNNLTSLLFDAIHEFAFGLHEGTNFYNAIFYKTNYSLVENETIDRFSETHGETGEKRNKKESDLFNLLLELKNEQTIIYCSSPVFKR